jgi:hypothetical protein
MLLIMVCVDGNNDDKYNVNCLCSSVFLEKLIVVHLVKTVTVFYGTKRFLNYVYKSAPLVQ